MWTPEADQAFRRLKMALTSGPVLRNPDFSRPFVLQTDASETGLGAVLSQDVDGEEHPVVFISTKLTPAESRYAAVEREALAVKWAVQELRYYLLGRRFTLVTDHAPLQWMSRAKDTNARVTRWFLALQDFDFHVEHRPGRAHANADALSRRDACYWAVHGDPGFLLGVGKCGNPTLRQPLNSDPPLGRQCPRMRGHVVNGRYVLFRNPAESHSWPRLPIRGKQRVEPRRRKGAEYERDVQRTGGERRTPT